MEILKFHPQVIHICLGDNQSSKHFLCLVVYASPHATTRRDLWPFLSSLADSIMESWIFTGDFNCILDSTKRSGGASLTHVGCKWFQKFFFDNGLRDMEASGARFTWYRGGLAQRLDRAICNTYWDSFAPDCSVHNIYKLKSDHRPVLISLQPGKRRGNRLFRCLASWFCRSDFRNVISKKK